MYESEKDKITGYKTKLAELRACLNADNVKQEIEIIEKTMGAPGFWDDTELAQKSVQKLKGLRGVISAPDEIAREIEDAETLCEMGAEAEDASLADELAEILGKIDAKLHRLEMNSLFMDPRDSKSALVNFHPGAGGTESCDWAEILYRMFTRFCEMREFDVEVLDYQPGEEAGLKSASLRVSGPYAYGTLKSEDGVHRLVRISPFDAAARRHTSFSAIEVLAEIDDDIEVDIREDDIKMDVYRSSGAGGQKVNKTSSAVRLTHLPTGIVVACQIERSQHRNRATAMSMLKAKLYDLELKRKEAELNAMREGQQDVAWGSQIRSYVLHPYQMIKDHRTSAETGNVNRVLDGELDMFVEAYLKWNLERHSRTNHKD